VSVSQAAGEWSDPARVAEYLGREIPHRVSAEAMLLEALPADVRRVLDLGAGDGRMAALVRSAHPHCEVVALDASQRMLERARERFAGDPRVAVRARDL
jgi:ubiquinone/menaquinone biosynthesis C-methylase UbiE